MPISYCFAPKVKNVNVRAGAPDPIEKENKKCNGFKFCYEINFLSCMPNK
jgi:hypothetical protein